MEWQFNSAIAEKFKQHAQQHIPDYNRVLDLTIDLCNQKVHKGSPVLEIGCAIGETVTRLHNKGFTNIHAVDYSQAMLDKCPTELATYYCTPNFPKVDIKFDAILCNWTMHFVENKIPYLTKIYQSLKPGGMFILSEKTSNDGIALEQYHRYKSHKGVSDAEIQTKAESLVNVMFPENVAWYLQVLQRLDSKGFKQIHIANANWCFTTFVAIK
tara:strand:- start:1468 stop:2106 length:639 start_codon:yes stop_codon:yes gene_type:complete